MKNNFRLLIAGMMAALLFCGCDERNPIQKTDGIGTVKVDFKVKESAENMAASNVKMNIGGREFTIRLEDTEAARELSKRLPLSLEMTELNGNEKYANLASPLPTSVEKVGKIEMGDVMLWGNDCLVVFYKSFVTSYSYTRIGHVTEADGLAKAAGKGNVTIDFKAADE